MSFERKERSENNNIKLSGAEKAAVLLLSIDEDSASQVFGHMSQDEIREICYAMSKLGSLPNKVVYSVLSEFRTEMSDNFLFAGNLRNTEKLLSKFLDPEQVSNILSEISGPRGKNTWDKLGNVNEEMLANYLLNEHPQIVAIILSKIMPSQAAKVLKNFNEDFAFNIIFRMLNLGSVKREVLDKVEMVLKSEFVNIVTRTHKQDSFTMVAAILNNMDRSVEQRCIEMLDAVDSESATKIKNLMFTFEDILRVDRNGLRLLLNRIDKSKLVIALKSASEELKNMFLSNMSQRQAKIIMEEMEGMGKVRVKEVYAAQNAIIAQVKEMLNKGEIDIDNSGSDSQYI